jgi:general transcription factor 3C polypeptide 5 (transcription factor C subunit 1)
VGFKVTAVKYFEENAPTKSWHNLPQLKKPAEIETTELIRKLFEERPIWSRYGITSRLASNYHPFIRT